MQINFTGIRNIGYEFRRYREANYDDGSVESFSPDEDIDKEDYDEDVFEHYINLELTDDEDGQDLTEFRKQIKTSDLEGDCLHPCGDNLLNIVVVKEEYTDETKPDVTVVVNNHDDELEINDKNMSALGYIASLLTRISKAKEEDFVLTKDYIQNQAATSIILGEDLSKDYGKDYLNMLGQIHYHDNVKAGAKKMADIITEKVIDYLG